ncbi:MAG: hypothetical protein ACP5N2_00835 [Candidatus Nanoarchaeia archaeon]
MNRINSELELNELMSKYVSLVDKNSIKIIAGHLPLIYAKQEGNKLNLGVNRWGLFSEYTFALGTELLTDTINIGKEAELLVVVDDLVEIPLKEKNGKIIRDDKAWMKTKRKRFYSGSHLPQEYLNILANYGWSEDVIAEQRRNGGSYSNLISEKMTKANAISKGLIAPNECAQSYKGLIYDKQFFDTCKDALIAFVPGQCKGNICNGFLDTQKDIDSLHVFFPHMEDLGGLMSLGNGTYTKDNRKPLTIDEMFSSGVYYRIDKAQK